MTTIARCIDNEMQQRCNDDETMGTAQPAGRIRRRPHHSSCRIGVGVKGSQGGASGGRVGGELRILLMVELGSPCFFDDAMCVLAPMTTPQKSMVHPPCKYLCRLIQGRGTRWCPQN